MTARRRDLGAPIASVALRVAVGALTAACSHAGPNVSSAVTPAPPPSSVVATVSSASAAAPANPAPSAPSTVAATGAAATGTGATGTAASLAAASAPLSPGVSSPDSRVRLRASIDSLLDNPRFRNAFWGVLIVDPVHGDTIFARNADKLFLPASNMKILTGSVALTRLGPDFRFRTIFATTGHVTQGVLEGDLVVVGRGDPTASDHMMRDAMIPMRAAADSILAHGIRRITGRIVSGGDAFPGYGVGGWDWDDLTEDYGAGVDELFFNEGFAAITLHASKHQGGLATVSTAPLADYPPVQAHVTTVSRSAGPPLTQPAVAFDPAHGAVDIEGMLAPGDTTTLFVAYPDQTVAYLRAFADALRASGVALAPQPVGPPQDPAATLLSSARAAGHAPPPPAGRPLDTLFTLTSPPLRDVLAAMLKPSQNQLAEVLLRTLGLEITGVGSADSGRRVVESQLSAWGLPPDEYVIRDGSGLSRHDYVAPSTLVRVLTIISHDTAFSAFYDALPIAGVDGTLETRMRGTAAAGNVRAKTGFVDRARSLSGYVTTADGTRLVFSMLCNNWTTPVREVEQVQDEIAAQLALLNLGPP